MNQNDAGVSITLLKELRTLISIYFGDDIYVKQLYMRHAQWQILKYKNKLIFAKLSFGSKCNQIVKLSRLYC